MSLDLTRKLTKVVIGRFHSYVDGIYVGPSVIDGDVELRFGDGGRGSRTARLTSAEARVLAYALLAEAEKVLQQPKKRR